jgi:Fe-Mn family superoxide dismutase
MDGLDRREFVGLAGMGLLASSLLMQRDGAAQAEEGSGMAHTLPDLPYPYDALEPHYDRETLTIHHDKHHAGYVKGLNAAEAQLAEMLKAGDFSQAKAVCKALAFHGSGHVLHSIFWTNMKPGGGGEPGGALAAALDKSFGSFDAFKGLFLAAADSVEGSGWGVLSYREMDEGLVVLQAEKHENLTQWGVVPILVVDVWEHAYYLKYQNRRSEWTQVFMDSLVDWGNVAERLEAARA